MSNAFSQLNLHPQLVQAVADLGYTEPTPIQAAVIPVLMEGHDVIGQAQTGTGKTAAFALPMLHGLEPGQSLPQGLVLAPTRELAMQVAQAIFEMGRHLGVRVLAVYGGQPYARQISRIRKGVDVIVGTPGRMIDLINQHALDLSHVQYLVLDEADEMLSMGFVEDIETILKQTPSSRQTALFSATLPPEIRRLADRYLRSPQSIAIERKQLTVDAIEQRYYLVYQQDKLSALTRLFEVEPVTRGLVFARTRAGTGELANELTTRGYAAEVLNGDLSQEAREGVLARFRQNQIKVLVATDVAARGLDIDDVSHVFNFDLPQDPEVYVHRVGRTGRAGKSGVAISLVTPQEQWRLRRIEGYSNQSVTKATLPTVDEIVGHREGQLLSKLARQLDRGRYAREQQMIEDLVAEGHDPLEIAAAALKLARGDDAQRPIAPISEVQEQRARPAHRKERPAPNSRGNRSEDRRWSTESREKGMVRLAVNAGKVHGIRPGDIVGTIAFHANIPGKAIGAIAIRQEHSLVDIPEQFVDQVLAKAGSYKIRKQPIAVERA
ncbi:MAG: DEAD/DEAH box helicase [Caldilineaceae bacterium]|nr:DEAD/DEAH box helicase [Caldilineaceae bacterium]